MGGVKLPAFDLSGQRILVTGAGGGIGSAAARLCTEMGATVLACDLQRPDTLVEELRAQGSEAEGHSIDISVRREVDELFASSGRIHALIDCAAICPFDNWDDDEWDAQLERVFRINMMGAVYLTRAAMRAMRDSGGGRIALTGSIAGRIGGVRAAPHYVMSKGGIHSLVRWAAKMGAADNILVNAVAPGPVATPMTDGQPFNDEDFPLQRKAEAD
nr:SDR family oxidoreductase [Gammaproteobacteria bacterium]